MGIFTELGILYAKFKPAKLMEHLKLFGKRLNIPRLIRVCEEQGHWRELVHLYMQVRRAAAAAHSMQACMHTPVRAAAFARPCWRAQSCLPPALLPAGRAPCRPPALAARCSMTSTTTRRTA